VQDAFIACHGLQCGFCTPGMIMTRLCLLAKNPGPARRDRSMRWKATCAAAPATSTSSRPCSRPLRTMAGGRDERRPMAARFGSGQAVRRIEDPALVQGQGRFTDDVARPRALFLVFVRSRWRMPASSRSTPTVRAPCRAWWRSTPAPTWWPPASSRSHRAGLQAPDGKPMAAPRQAALAHERVRYVGEPVVP
jgi:hypothetical protein